MELGRTRPQLHFTPAEGWVNDPYGVTWVDDRYHMYFQSLPDRTTWGPTCRWGHAESVDLVQWKQRPTALAPQAFELGCWSGSVVVAKDGTPTAFYTRITDDDYTRGDVALAFGDKTWSEWHSAEDDVVILASPALTSARVVRDPFVFRYRDRWALILGAGLADGSGALLQYTSDDLRDWRFDGVVCARSSEVIDDVWSGSLWECPQLIQVDDTWLLLVSVWNDDQLHYVAGAVGHYDGRIFVAQKWQRLTWGDSAYAMTSFEDRTGRRCVMSWLREQPDVAPTQHGRPAGAHSMVAVVAVDNDGTIRLAPHPNIDALSRRDPPHQVIEGAVTRYSVGAESVEIVATGPTQLVLSEGGDAARLVLSVPDNGTRLTIHRPGVPDEVVPLRDGRCRIFLDADIVEVFATSAYGAYRLRGGSSGGTTLECRGSAQVRSIRVPS
jgi:beta-fructofuranosidase